jgi:hypothetical protein
MSQKLVFSKLPPPTPLKQQKLDPKIYDEIIRCGTINNKGKIVLRKKPLLPRDFKFPEELIPDIVFEYYKKLRELSQRQKLSTEDRTRKSYYSKILRRYNLIPNKTKSEIAKENQEKRKEQIKKIFVFHE